MDPLACNAGSKKMSVMTASYASQQVQNSILKEREGNLQVHAPIGIQSALSHDYYLNRAHLHLHKIMSCKVSWSVYESNIDCPVKYILTRLYNTTTNDVLITLKKYLTMGI